jgi:glycosyltransferase involved in cell wall biosynthesis
MKAQLTEISSIVESIARIRAGKVSACIIAKYFFPHDTRMKQQVEALRCAGIRTNVVCLRWEDQPKVAHADLVSVYRIARAHSKSGFLQYIVGTLSFGLLASLRLFVLSLRNCPSVVIVHTLPEFLIFSAAIPKLMGKAIILDARDLSFELLHSRWAHNQILCKVFRPLFGAMEWISTRFADQIITASAGFKKRLVERGVKDKKIVTIVNSADDTIFKFDVKRHFEPIKSDVKLIYHGTVAERFGILVAVEAIHLIQACLPNSKFFIYGKYEECYRRLLDRKIEELKLSKLVFMNGYRPLEWLYETMKSIDIGIVPYLSDDFMNLALSTKGFEYAAAGVPIVASRLDSMQSVFDDNCLSYFKPGNASDLAEKIIDLCNDAKKRQHQVRAARIAYDNVSGDSNSLRLQRLVISMTKGGIDVYPQSSVNKSWPKTIDGVRE